MDLWPKRQSWLEVRPFRGAQLGELLGGGGVPSTGVPSEAASRLGQRTPPGDSLLRPPPWLLPLRPQPAPPPGLRLGRTLARTPAHRGSASRPSSASAAPATAARTPSADLPRGVQPVAAEPAPPSASWSGGWTLTPGNHRDAAPKTRVRHCVPRPRPCERRSLQGRATSP
ncbi:hypothetical protein NN561_016011 [Cricetulus griseus]